MNSELASGLTAAERTASWRAVDVALLDKFVTVMTLRLLTLLFYLRQEVGNICLGSAHGKCSSSLPSAELTFVDERSLL